MVAKSRGKAGQSVSVMGIDERKTLQTRSSKAGLQVRLRLCELTVCLIFVLPRYFTPFPFVLLPGFSSRLAVSTDISDNERNITCELERRGRFT